MIMLRSNIADYLIVWLLVASPATNYAMRLDHHTENISAAAATEAITLADTDDECELDLSQDSGLSKEESHQILVMAIKAGNADTVRQLIAQKADVHYQPSHDLSQLKTLESSTVRPVPVPSPINPLGSLVRKYTYIPHNPSDWTPLMHATHERFADIAQLLIDSKASVHARTKNGQTALHILLYSSKNNNEHYEKPKNRDTTTYGYTATSQTLVLAGARLDRLSELDSNHWKFALPHIQSSVSQAACAAHLNQLAVTIFLKQVLQPKHLPHDPKPPIFTLPASLVQYILTFVTSSYEREQNKQTMQSNTAITAHAKKNSCVIL